MPKRAVLGGLLAVVVACASPPPPVPPPPDPKPPPAPAPIDPTADCAAIDEVFTTFKYPTADTPSEADLVRYYGNVTKAFREIKLATPELAKVAKDVAELFGALGARADAIAKAYVAYDAALGARNKKLTDLYEAMRAIWNLREFCETADCKKLFEVEKAHHAVVRVPPDDATAFKNAIRAFRTDLASVLPAEQSVGFARRNLENALGAYEETSLRLAESQAALDETVRAKESKLLRGRILGFCRDLGEKR
jgi:hypothetical protein